MNTSKSLKGILLKFLEDNDGLWDQFMEGDDPDPQKYDEMTDNALNEAVAAIVEAVEGLIGEDDWPAEPGDWREIAKNDFRAELRQAIKEWQ